MSRTLLPLIEAEFVRYKLIGERAMRQVRPEELNVRTEHGNSVAIIVWHVSGNLESKFTRPADYGWRETLAQPGLRVRAA